MTETQGKPSARRTWQSSKKRTPPAKSGDCCRFKMGGPLSPGGPKTRRRRKKTMRRGKKRKKQIDENQPVVKKIERKLFL